MKDIIFGGHELFVCKCYKTACMFCDGGLSSCVLCAAFEGAWPDDCPRVRMTTEQSDAVYDGGLNFRAGEWREECCQIRRIIYDTDAYMAEGGYRRGNPELGERQWEKINE